ncbi:hypothetical protein HQ560_01235 [bacterium]|nr:hypothetical protein [bacterium]
MTLRSALVPLVLAAVAAGGVPPAMERRLATLEQQQADLVRRTATAEAAVERFKNLGADVEAVKAYFKQVADRVRGMRDDMVRLLDEQSLLVEEGRKEYVRILRVQEQVLSKLLPEVTKAIQSLEKKLPEAGATLPAAPPPPDLGATPGPPPPPNRDTTPVLPPPPNRDTTPILPAAPR